MNKYFVSMITLLLSLSAHAANWIEGQHYSVIKPTQLSGFAAPGKIEVVEVFSYGCPACFQFYPIADKLKASLPSNAQMVYVPASFNPSEDWPMFQRAYCTASSLGIAEKTHNQMFEAVWSTGELGVLDKSTQRLKKVLPSIEDAAKFYSRTTGTKPEAFVAASKSFGVDSATRRSDELVKAWRVPSTPTIVVNGKYRLDVTSAGGVPQLMELVKWLIAKESQK